LSVYLFCSLFPSFLVYGCGRGLDCIFMLFSISLLYMMGVEEGLTVYLCC
jgi:hypothetical protein